MSCFINLALATIVPHDATRLRKRGRPNACAGAFEPRPPWGWPSIPAPPLPRSWAADMWAGKWLAGVGGNTPRSGLCESPGAGVHPRRHARMAGLATPPGGHHRPRHAREQPRRMVFSQQAAAPGGRDPAERACPLKPRAPRVPPGSVGKRSTTFHMMVPKPARSNGTRPSRATGDIS
jgi:hypothetical protein